MERRSIASFLGSSLRTRGIIISMIVYFTMCGELFSYDWFIPPLQMLISTGYRKVHSNAYRRPRQYIHHHWVLGRVTPGCAFLLSVCILMLPVLQLAAEHMESARGHLNPMNQRHAYPHLKTLSCTPLMIPSLNNVLPVMVLQNRVVKMNMRHPSSHSSVLQFFPLTSPVLPSRLSAAVGRRAVGAVVVLLLLMSGDIETNPGPLSELLLLPYSDINMSLPDNINSTQDKGNRYISMTILYCMVQSVADSGGVRGVQMHPPLAASNVFLRT